MKRIVALLVLASLFGIACTGDTEDSNKESQRITESFAQKLQAAVPYPLADMNDSLERRNLKERLLRFNDADKIGYVYILTLTGDFVGFYTIKGKISSVQSQLTADNQVRKDWGAVSVVNSMGDDGSFGPNEGGDQGIFFFTTEDVMVETVMPWLYSDAPLPVDAKKLNEEG